MSEDLAGVGMQVAGLFEKAEQVHDQGKMVELQTELDTMYSQYQQRMLESPNDALMWRENFDAVLSNKQMEIDKRDMSGNLRRKTEQYFSRFSGDRKMRVSHTAHKTVYENANKSVELRMQDLRERGLLDEELALATNARDEGLLSDNRLQQVGLDVQRQKDFNGVEQEMKDAPLKFIEDAEAGKYKGLVNPTNLNRLVINAKKTISNRSIDSFTVLKNRTDAAEFDSVKELEDDEDFAKLTPSNKKDAREYYYNSTDEQTELYFKDPANHGELYGGIDMLFYDAKRGEIPDAGTIGKIQAQMKWVQDPAKKSEYQQKLDNLITGKEEKLKTLEDDGNRQLDAHYSRKEKALIKPETTEYTRDDYIERGGGFYTDENLKRFGIKEKLRKAILKGGKIDFGGKDANISFASDKIPSSKVRSKLLAQVWDAGEKGRDMANDAKLNEFQRKFIRSIHRGSGKDVLSKYDDPVAGKKYDDKVLQIKRDLGNEKVKLRSFLRDKPNATQTDVNTFLGSERTFKRASGAGSLIQPAPVQYPSGASTDVNENPWGKLGGDLLDFESDEELAELLQQGKEAQLAVDIKDEEKKRVASNSKK